MLYSAAQYVTYCCNMSHIVAIVSYYAAIYHILLQHVTYRCNMSHIVAICHIAAEVVRNKQSNLIASVKMLIIGVINKYTIN